MQRKILPKEFIQEVLIDEYKDIVDRHTYIAFSLIAIGIEFLGKCMLTQYQDWHNIPADKAFNRGLDLMILDNITYGTLNLKDELRNGFVHTLSPKLNIALSEVRHGALHFSTTNEGKTILVIEIFYRDFVIACKRVLAENFPETDKMNIPFIGVGTS
jgi:hypothetical protein